MTGYFSLYKQRHDPFHPPSPPPSTPASARNPNPFDPNLYVPAQTPSGLTDSQRKDQQNPNSNMDFTEELAALMKSSGPTSATPNGTANFDDYSRHPPHNIFDVSAPPSAHHHSHFPHPFSIPVPAVSHYRPGSSHHQPESPYTAHSPFSAHSEGGFAHHQPLPSPLPPLNINGHHPPGPEDLSPFVHHPPPLPMSASGRPSSPLNDSRSRSRSKPPMSAGGLPPGNPARSRMSKKRASMSGIERPHPSAIMIPSNGSRPNTSSGSAPLSAHAMGWPAFSLPTPDSMSTHAFGSFGEKNGIPAKKEEEPELDPVSKQAALAHEKRRRRRESHNAVERRRRDNINEKISELATLIPECLLEPTPTATGTQANGNNKEMGMEVFTTGGGGLDDDSKEPPAIKANKGMILRKSVDYIRYLQQLVTAQANRNRDLEAQLQALHARGIQGASPSISSPHSSDSAPELHGPTHNFHVFGDELIGGMNGMGMVDLLHSLGPEDGEQYLGMQYNGVNGGALKSPQQQRYEGLETLHEHEQNGDPRRDYKDPENDGDMELDDTSPSASADSPEDLQIVEKEELERGRTRVRPHKSDLNDAEEVIVKKERSMES